MWEEWTEYVNTDDCRRYELMIRGSMGEVALGAYLTRVSSLPVSWEVIVNAFNPGAGEYVLYEATFPGFAEAEREAWEQAAGAAKRYRTRLKWKSTDDRHD
jgi:hypothetical protein